MSNISMEFEDSKKLNLKILDPDGTITNFKVVKTTPLIRVMNMYCQRRGYKDGELRFRFDGQPIAEETPISLGMVDGDVIETFKFQMNG